MDLNSVYGKGNSYGKECGPFMNELNLEIYKGWITQSWAHQSLLSGHNFVRTGERKTIIYELPAEGWRYWNLKGAIVHGMLFIFSFWEMKDYMKIHWFKVECLLIYPVSRAG